ncbi:mycoredoxin [Dietzia sp.]|uniref:mycoredoxin n=1 Tax=Dietzia sp. TaxID=1871616 RepID=UPI002FD9A5AD
MAADSIATPSAPRDFTMFTTSWCPFCSSLKRALDSAGTPYTEVDVEQDADAAAFVESVNGGNRVVPTVLYSDASTATNPDAGSVKAKLDELAG